MNIQHAISAVIQFLNLESTQEYLYYFCDPPVFHVSVNSGNVMMDGNFVAKVRLSPPLAAQAKHSETYRTI